MIDSGNQTSIDQLKTSMPSNILGKNLVKIQVGHSATTSERLLFDAARKRLTKKR